MTWRSIKDDPPPKDGTKFLAFWPETDAAAGNDTMTTTWWGVTLGGIGRWETAWSSGTDDEQPTHWMMLDPPA